MPAKTCTIGTLFVAGIGDVYLNNRHFSKLAHVRLLQACGCQGSCRKALQTALPSVK